MVKLRVTVGGSYTDLAIVNCNDELHPIEFDAPNFKGRAMVRIKDFVGITNDGSEPTYNSDYFKGHHRRFSLQVEGQFKKEWDGSEVYFGTDFDRPVDLPDGFEMMLKICRYIDPVVRAQLIKEPKPWVLSPIVSSINSMSAWHPRDILPVPTPRHQAAAASRPMSMDLSRAFSLTESGVSSAWGFLGKLKRNRSSVMSASSNSTSGMDSYATSANTSSDQLESSGSSNGSNGSNHSKRQGSSPGGLQTSPTTPQPGSLSSSPTTKTGPSLEAMKTATSEFDDKETLGPWRQYLEEDTTFFLPDAPSLSTSQRRKYFQSEQNRKDFKFKPDLVHGFEFFSPHMDFNTFDIRLGLSLNVKKYLGGQPVRYICRTLDGETVFWAVQFELVE
ncbi:hypothetical protein EMPS_07122 [Entomortierella parvispora]|uniref:Domain of unknown function at the cortex 1 domain-containing protein n=1 Tax=Entomortierella parvispora TaxID=205924 RepID=A0A9P3HDM1_9FUNG|nr:hypothetical protein EMPS_07122 [Entomortierella parvispora]